MQKVWWVVKYGDLRFEMKNLHYALKLWCVALQLFARNILRIFSKKNFWPSHTNMSNKMTPSSCLSTVRSDIRNPQLLTKISGAKRAFRSQGRPLECVDEKKFGLREKVGIGVKSWHQGLKSGAEYEMTFSSSNIMLSKLLTSQPYLRSISFDMVRV